MTEKMRKKYYFKNQKNIPDLKGRSFTNWKSLSKTHHNKRKCICSTTHYYEILEHYRQKERPKSSREEKNQVTCKILGIRMALNFSKTTEAEI